ncbi:MAG: efflux RND transporter periplasmic adaptor subunit [Phycisphaerae bacterium]
MKPWKRRGSIRWYVVVTIAVVCAGVGFWGGRRPGSPASSRAASAPGDNEETWYTCGMHPEVLQREPGNCPQCNMKLTPMKVGASRASDSAIGGPEERKVLYWRAPMDPNYVSDTPGKSPMGMDLVPVYADAGDTITGDAVRINPVTIQNMGLRTERVRRGPLVKIVRTLGRVDYDEQRVVFVDTKFNGWIEKLYVDETGQPVQEGQPLFDVYSPELYSAQVEYVSAKRKLPELERSPLPDAVEDARRLVEAGRVKLKYYDISDEQIDALTATSAISKTMLVRSPAAGIVTEKMAIQKMPVKPGMRLYTIADLSRVWVYVDIYEYQLPWVTVGQDAMMTLSYLPGHIFRGKVVYIYPYLQKETRVIKVRLEFDNPTLELKPDMYATVMLEGRLREDAVLIPREAYIDSGTRKLVFVDRGHGQFEPRDIQTGVDGEGGRVEVLQGLDENDIVVTSGQFLLDAESKLQEAVAKMMKARRAPAKNKTAASATTRPHDHGGASGIPDEAEYACPMDAHPDQADPANQGAYFASEPGKCPRCGMKLQSIEELAWAQAQKASSGGDVAYTCPDHEHVFSDKPGRCPRCGRQLDPFKVLYTCRNIRHAGVVSVSNEDCRRCGDPPVAFRGPWLGEAMAAGNVPPDAAAAETAAYRCPVHPLVHSNEIGNCTICGAPLEAVRPGSEEARPTPALAKYVCPMHPEKVARNEPGICPICAMQLVERDRVIGIEETSDRLRQQMNYITEHYLGLQKLLSSDSTTDAARHALGLVDAAEALARNLRKESAAAPEALAAAEHLRDAALKITGADIAGSRAHFADLSRAVRTLLKHVRPDRTRWPKLYIFHCPMSRGDWIQTSEKKANPYYGFKMLDCGKLVETR